MTTIGKIITTYSILLCALPLSAQVSGSTGLSFFGKATTITTDQATPSQLMELLDDEALEWVQSIDCKNVRLNPSFYGITLYTTSEAESYLKIYFKNGKIPVLSNFQVYGTGIDKSKTSVTMTFFPANLAIKKDLTNLNETTPYVNGSVSLQKFREAVQTGSDFESIMSRVSAGTSTFTDNQLGCTSMQITLPQEAGNDCRIYGIRPIYKELKTLDDNSPELLGVNETANDENPDAYYEYYDMQGRRLQAPCKSGLCIRRNTSNGKVEKLLIR